MPADAIIVVFGKLLDDGAGEDRHVARRTICSSAGKPFGLTKWIATSRCGPHAGSSGRQNFSTEPADAFRDHHRDVIADFTISILSALSTVTVVPAENPILTGDWAAALWETVRSLSSVIRPS